MLWMIQNFFKAVEKYFQTNQLSKFDDWYWNQIDMYSDSLKFNFWHGWKPNNCSPMVKNFHLHFFQPIHVPENKSRSAADG